MWATIIVKAHAVENILPHITFSQVSTLYLRRHTGKEPCLFGEETCDDGYINNELPTNRKIVVTSSSDVM